MLWDTHKTMGSRQPVHRKTTRVCSLAASRPFPKFHTLFFGSGRETQGAAMFCVTGDGGWWVVVVCGRRVFCFATYTVVTGVDPRLVF